MTSTTITPDVNSLSSAIERRDAGDILSWYASDAVLTVLDRDHPPAAPAVYAGSEAIGAYYRDICGRNISHQVRDAVITSSGLAYTQYCRYPEGAAVVCSAVATLSDGKIQRQTAIQVWDA